MEIVNRVLSAWLQALYGKVVKILLSAYACEPDKGSEPGVGWHWAVELASLGHDVWVITRANNEPVISEALAKAPIENLRFAYHDLPGWLKWWKKGRRGVHLYYLFWQIGIFLVARSLAKKVKFDVVHHVTFVSVRQPSFLGLLGIPFIFGPVAGGERAPMALRKSYPLRGWLLDLLRDVVNMWVKFSPLMHLTFATAKRIYVTSEQTRRLLPVRYLTKTAVQLAVGIENVPQDHSLSGKGTSACKVLFVGQLLYWKGVHLALRAFAEFLQRQPRARFTVVGSGPDESWLKGLAAQLNIGHAVDWIQWMPHSETMQLYRQHDIFLFPSLHDSGGMAVLEAMANGLPVVCLALGGPGEIVDDNCGRLVKTRGKTEDEVIEDLAKALTELLNDVDLWQASSKGARVRAQGFAWPKVVAEMYRALEGIVGTGKK